MYAARETPPLPPIHGLHGVYPALQIVVYGRFPRKPRPARTPQQRFWVRDRVWSMRRGGNHAARRNDALPPVYGLRVVYFTL